MRKLLNVLYVYIKYKAYLKFQFKSKKEIKRFQEKKLKKVLQVAVNKVPFYKQYKDKIDFENFSLKELEKLPIISKGQISKDITQFIREDIAINGLTWKATSGSSGKPFQVPKMYFSDAIEVVLGYRAWSFGEHNYKIREPAIVLRSFSPKHGEPIYKRDWVRNFWYLSPYHINEKYLEEFLQVFKKSKAKILKGYPSSIYILTLLLKKNKLNLPQIKTIITSSETMLPKYRNEIEDYWRCEVLDWYGQNERTVTVQQCGFGNYHNNDDYGIIEVDKSNSIIATSLNNTIMPLIRYQTNDIAMRFDSNTEVCKCGKELSIPFRGVQGRQDDILYNDQGNPIPTINFYNLMEKFQKVKQFHLLQEENLSLKMTISENEKMDENDLDNLKRGVFQRFGQDILLDIKVVNEIERSKKTDKIKIIESEVKMI